jgi:NADH-quinone oxidoreductase subunit D
VPTEGPEGELGFFLISDGTDKPYRLRARTPSFAHYQYFPRLLGGTALADVDSVLASLNVSPEEVDR